MTNKQIFALIEQALRSANNWEKNRTKGNFQGVLVRRSEISRQSVPGVGLVDHWGYAGVFVSEEGKGFSIEFGGQYMIDGNPVDRPN